MAALPFGFGLDVHQQAETVGPLHTIAPHSSFVLIDDIAKGGSLSTLKTVVSGYKAQLFKTIVCLNASSWGTDIVGHARDVAVTVKPDCLCGPGNEMNRTDSNADIDPALAGAYVLAIKGIALDGLASPRLLGAGSMDYYMTGYSDSGHNDSAAWWASFMATGAHNCLDFKECHGYSYGGNFPSSFDTPAQRAARVAAFHATTPNIPTICTEMCFREDSNHGHEVTYLKGSYTAANMAALVEEERSAIMAIPGVVGVVYFHAPYDATTTDVSYQNSDGTISTIGSAISGNLSASAVVGVGG